MLSDKEIKLVKIRMVILDMTLEDVAKYVGASSLQQIHYVLRKKRNSVKTEEQLRKFIEPLQNVDIWGL